MKNLFSVFILLTGILISAGLAAQTTSKKAADVSKTTQNIQQATVGQAGPNFVDKDGDGICDNRSGRHGGNRNFIDSNNDGVCDNFTTAGNNRQRRNFIDSNNDGVCDNLANSTQGRGKRSGTCNGKGQGRKNRHGQQPLK